jgi:putative membrane protein
MSEKALQLLGAWSWDPSILIGTAILLAAYFGAVSPFRRRIRSSDRVPPTQIAWFVLGTGAMLFALVSPLDEIGDGYLFTAHMLQHALLMFVAPPLWLMGTPGWMLRPLLRSQRIKQLAVLFTTAPVAFLVFNADVLLWHLPALYELTLANENVHIVEHLSFLVTGVLNWWPILSPLEELPRLSYPAQIAYLLLELVPTSVLGWFFVSATTVIYPTYAAAPYIFAIHGLDDQLLGGYMMAMPEGTTYLAAIAIILRQWASRVASRGPV